MEADIVQWLCESYKTIHECYQLKSLSVTNEGACLDLKQHLIRYGHVRSQLLHLKQEVETNAALKNQLESLLQNLETKEKIYLDLEEKNEIEKFPLNYFNIHDESELPKTQTSDSECLDLEQGSLKTNMLIEKYEFDMQLQALDNTNKIMYSLLNLNTKLETSNNKVLDLEKELLKKDKMLADLKNSVEIKETRVLDLERQILEKEEMRLQLLNDLRKQGELYLQKIEEKDEICSDLRDKVLQKDQLLTAQKLQLEDYQQQCFGMNQRRLQLLADLKQQEDSHLQELETRNNIISQLQQEQGTKKINFDLNVSCSICLEATNTNEHRLVSLQCGHLFGDKCVRDCINKYLECPLCRNPASLNEIRNIYCN